MLWGRRNQAERNAVIQDMPGADVLVVKRNASKRGRRGVVGLEKRSILKVRHLPDELFCFAAIFVKKE